MEEISFGLLKGIECRFVKTDPEIVEFISNKRGIGQERVREMLRYNIFTFNQFSRLTQMTIGMITNKTRPSVINGGYNTELDYCFPFQDDERKGPKFIVRNEKSEKYIRV